MTLNTLTDLAIIIFADDYCCCLSILISGIGKIIIVCFCFLRIRLVVSKERRVISNLFFRLP